MGDKQNDAYQRASIATWGLALQAQDIQKALFGKTPDYKQEKYEKGPFHKALLRLAEIAEGCAEGAEITDREQARQDAEYVMRFVDILGNNFANVITPMIHKARTYIVPPEDRINVIQAAQILGEGSVIVEVDISSNLLHPVTYDENYNTFLDRWEVEQLKKTRERVKQQREARP